MSIPCAGIIVFNNKNDDQCNLIETIETILVNTESGNFSFPKGKRHKCETPIQAAWRELEEETGLTSEYVKLIDENYIDELSNKGHPSVRYFVGILIKPQPVITFDKYELANVAWYSIDYALKIKKFKTIRKEILIEACKKYKSVLNQ